LEQAIAALLTAPPESVLIDSPSPAVAAEPPPPVELAAEPPPPVELAAEPPPPVEFAAAPPPVAPPAAPPPVALAAAPPPVGPPAALTPVALDHAGETALALVPGTTTQLAVANDFSDHQVLCTICGRYCSILKVRVRNKSAGTFWCCLCQTRTTQLYRTFGNWPTSEYRLMQPNDQKKFMASMCDITDLKTLRSTAIENFNRYASLEDQFSEGGSFFPLNVWAVKGFDSTAIEEFTLDQDKRMHPVLGLTYRVRIFTQTLNGVSGWRRESGLRGSSAISMPKAPKALADGAADAAEMEIDNGDDVDGEEVDGEEVEDEEEEEDDDDASESDDSSSTSSSSSSSSSHKKKKKSKKSKKDKKKKKAAKKAKKDKKKAQKHVMKQKAKEREDKLKAKEEEKATKLAERAASKDAVKRGAVAKSILDKCLLLKVGISALMGRPHYVHIAGPVKEPMELAFKELITIEKDARACVDDNNKPLPSAIGDAKAPHFSI